MGDKKKESGNAGRNIWGRKIKTGKGRTFRL
jgi:hypothetical protein